ncbi:MAG: hypothetical protein ACFFEE_11995, partial [Candidatus Thorarchaeota archaeon]
MRVHPSSGVFALRYVGTVMSPYSPMKHLTAYSSFPPENRNNFSVHMLSVNRAKFRDNFVSFLGDIH